MTSGEITQSTHFAPKITAIIVLETGDVIEGHGIGATGEALGEVCFNTAMTGYQEILTDPSYAGQIITFTFPHIGNVGANDEDIETVDFENIKAAKGIILRAAITEPSNYRATQHFDDWLKTRDIVGVTGVDTRALTARIREKGYVNAIIQHNENGTFDLEQLKGKLKEFKGLLGQDLVPDVTQAESYSWDEKNWIWNKGFSKAEEGTHHIVAIDYGAKRNILRCLANVGCRLTIVPPTTAAKEILALNPDGIFLSNGPGDPEATGTYAIPIIQELMKAGVPIFGICLGHQLLGLALGAKTIKMHQGHHGANHPVQDLTTGKVEITSMNHGFAVDAKTLPKGVVESHKSLFDGTNCGLMCEDKPIFSVQHHPEASPGPQDSHYIFKRFINMIIRHRDAA